MNGILKDIADSNVNNVWTVKMDGQEINRIKNNLSYMSDKEKSNTVLSAAKILSNCPNPKGQKQKCTGLAIGKVQSGKTSNFIALTALAFDNEYNIVIIFGGNTNLLLSQTEARIDEMFDLKNGRREAIEVLSCSSSNDFSGMKPDELENRYKSGKKIIITALKNYTHIGKVVNFIKNASLADKPILIIDDEGDQMSLNGAVASGKMTTTYKEFKEMRNSFEFSAFISVTATPEANLLIDTCDELSPDFFQLIEPGNDYNGANTFHHKLNSEYIYKIPESENEILDNDSGIPKSFELALSTFFVGSAIRKIRKDNKTHSMLIHPSHKVFDHATVYKKVRNLLANLNEEANSIEKEVKERFEKFVSEGYEELSKTVLDIIPINSVIEQVKKEMLDTKVLVVNRDGEGSDIDYSKFTNMILIGGNMVERGLTIKNLSVTYIVREAKGKANADTVEQRARWFGYRKGYLDVCRIFCTEKIERYYYDLRISEESIWESIISSQKLGIPAKQVPRIYEFAGNLNPTRKNVAPNIAEYVFDRFTWQKSVEDFTNLNEINNDLSLILKDYKYDDRKIGNNVFRFFENVDIEKFYRDIISKHYSNKSIRFDYKYILVVMNRLKQLKMPALMDVVIMRYGQNEERTIYEDQTVSNIMQGRNKRPGEVGYYPGDSEIHNNKIQLQVHNVISKTDKSGPYPLLSFYSPNIGDVKRLVGNLYDR